MILIAFIMTPSQKFDVFKLESISHQMEWAVDESEVPVGDRSSPTGSESGQPVSDRYQLVTDCNKLDPSFLVRSSSWRGVIRTPSTPFANNGIALHEHIEILLDRGQGQTEILSDTSGLRPSMALDVPQYVPLPVVQALYGGLQFELGPQLLHHHYKAAQEEVDPRSHLFSWSTCLTLAKYTVVLAFAPFDLVLEADVLHPGVSLLQQEQGGQQPAHAAVAVLEWMYGNELVTENHHTHQWMHLVLLVVPADECAHGILSLEAGWCSSEDHRATTIGGECFHGIGALLVTAPMPLVLRAVPEGKFVKMLQFTFTGTDIGVCLADGIERFEVPGHLLLVPVLESGDVKAGKQGIDIGIIELAAFDTCGCTHTLDRRDLLQMFEGTSFTPFNACPFSGEAVDLTDGLQKFPVDFKSEGVNGGHIRKYTQIYESDTISSVLYPQISGNICFVFVNCDDCNEAAGLTPEGSQLVETEKPHAASPAVLRDLEESHAFCVRDRSGKPTGLSSGRGLAADSPTVLILSAGTPKCVSVKSSNSRSVARSRVEPGMYTTNHPIRTLNFQRHSII